jgi:hypothetical protein
MAKRMMDIGVVAVESGGVVVGNDLAVSGGDFVVEESKVAHNTHLVICNKGEFDERPLMCVGAVNYIDDDAPNDFIQEIAAQLRGDGMDVKSVRLVGGVVQTEGYYK